MHISAARLGAATALATNEKSTAVPPGLARRGLTLPPGITKKLESGGALPEGIAKRFPAPVTPALSETASDTPTGATQELSISVEFTSSVSLNITV
jgi:hypothetical protein